MNCSNCGADLPTATKFCRHCGAKTESTESAPDRPQRRTPRPDVGVSVARPTGTGATLAIIVILAVAVGAGLWLIPGVGSAIKLTIASSVDEAHRLFLDESPPEPTIARVETVTPTEPSTPFAPALPPDTPAPAPTVTTSPDPTASPVTPSTAPPVSIAPPPAQASFSPSFDCTKASNQVEFLVCGSQSLSQLDNELSRAYGRARNIALDKNRLRADQATWLTQIRNACSDESCLIRVYQDRIATLDATNKS